jgi:glycosyltransferase involved in cell wall biosynthesis
MIPHMKLSHFPHEIYSQLTNIVKNKAFGISLLNMQHEKEQITIYHASPYVIEEKPSHKHVSSQELRLWIQSGRLFRHLFRYKKATLASYDLTLIAKPFALTLLTKLLSRTQASRSDKKGNQQPITFSLLISLLLKLLKDYLKKGSLVKQIEKEVKNFPTTATLDPQNDLLAFPIYLRTDFCFGLQSGGSVGHIAGVLNNLAHFTKNAPLFFTTDQIPTVFPEIKTHILNPGKHFWDFSELPPLYCNSKFCEQIIQVLKEDKPSFIYQRYSINNFSGVKLATHYKIPLVLEFNGSEVWISRKWGNQTLKYGSLAEKIERLNLLYAHLIVVVSKPLKQQLIDCGIDEKKILVNPNGVNLEKYSPEVSGKAVREKFQLEKKIVLGFIGTFGKWHGAEVLAEAFVKLLKLYPELRSKIRLLMIGDGMTLPLVKEILSENKGDAILTGTIPQDEGPSYLAACDILVSPHVPNADGSPFFGSPTKLFEYMAMGKAIVASNLNQIGEILEHDKTAWMAKPGDVSSLVEGLKTLIDNKDTRERLGMAARKEVVQNYSWKEHTRKIIEKLSTLYA